MALIKTKARGISLADNFAFTGTVTGAGSNSGFRFIKKVQITTSNSIFDLTNLFSADYNHYKLIWDIVGEDTGDNDTSHAFQFLKASDGTVDTTGDINYVYHGTDSQGSARGGNQENVSYFNFNYNTVEDTIPAYYEMSVFAPFASEYTAVNSLNTYMVNSDVDTTTSNGSAMRDNTTSYSGMRLVLTSANTSITPDSGSSATGTLLVYGMAES